MVTDVVIAGYRITLLSNYDINKKSRSLTGAAFLLNHLTYGNKFFRNKGVKNTCMEDIFELIQVGEKQNDKYY